MAQQIVTWRHLVAVVFFASAAAGQFLSCFPDSAQDVSQSNSFDFTGVDEFGLKLFRELVPPSSSGSNLLMSPYSIWSALGLALMGAQGNTKLQLEKVLKLPNNKLQAFRTKYAMDFMMRVSGSGASGGPELRAMDRAYFDKGLSLRPCVSNVIQSVEIVDFGDTAKATAKINDDVSQATGGQIKDFLSPAALVNAVFVLINAIYFKGTWETKFNAQDTTKQVFYNALGERAATVDMMTLTGQFKIVNSPPLGATMLELPYDKSNITMLVLLPDSKNPSVDGVLQNLTPYTLREAMRASQKLSVKIMLPKFDLTTEIQNELVLALGNLGITDMFNPVRANFSDFTSETPLFADTAVHQAKVAVDEEGTVAAAATAIIGTRSRPGRVFDFIVNRPFIFLIYEHNVRAIIFAGVIRNPSK
uniref:Serpin B11-like n=1 Tax=Hirondellea gigas TaxID=1518452 RepID=A0A2P2I515_9CRUS